MRPSIKIALIYTSIGIIWILLSDYLSLLFYSKFEMEYFKQIQSFKGIFYVVITGLLLYFLVRFYYNKLHKQLNELTELNRKLAEQKRELELSNTELEQFSYIVSHDLQEPLRMISNFATRISQKYDHQLDDKGKQYIQFVVSGAAKIRSLILDLLEYSHATKEQTNYESVALKDVIDDVMFLFRQKISDTKARIIVPQNLPELKSNKSLIQLIIQNILENGLKYCHEERTPEIEIEIVQLDANWQFCIKDNGIGIEADYLDSIFTIFYRHHTAKQSNGNGMGLTIVKKIIEKINGRIWVESVPGEGSSFYFTIPIDPTNDVV